MTSTLTMPARAVGRNGNGVHYLERTISLAGRQPGAEPEARVCDTLIISDLHLGSDVCRAKAILRVLKGWSYRRLIILGDAFDDLRFQRLKRSHFKVLSRINKLSGPKSGVQVIWVEGNHDNLFLSVVSHMLGVQVHDEYEFTVGGARYLALHGHRFDDFMARNPRISSIASWFYLAVQRRESNTQSFSRLLKKKTKAWLRVSDRIALMAANYGRKRGADVVMCGHTHMAVNRRYRNGMRYVNTGCWTDTPSHYATIDESGIRLHVFH